MTKKTGSDGPDPFLRAAEIADGGNIAIVGDISRTTYADLDQLFQTMEVFGALCENGFRVIHAQQIPYDDHIERMAQKLGLEVMRCRAPAQRHERLKYIYQRPVGMLEAAALVLAFPREDGDFTSADPLVMVQAFEDGLPILSVKRESVELVLP